MRFYGQHQQLWMFDFYPLLHGLEWTGRAEMISAIHDDPLKFTNS